MIENASISIPKQATIQKKNPIQSINKIMEEFRLIRNGAAGATPTLSRRFRLWSETPGGVVILRLQVGSPHRWAALLSYTAIPSH